MQPRDRFITANRLRHHLLEWGDSGPVVVCLHGFLEHAHAFDLVAPGLARAGHHVFALDLRGHGDSEPVGAGGYYHFADYVADLAGIVRELGGEAAIVGHSMGGSVSNLFAGAEPERVRALALIEGTGPPGGRFDEAPQRLVEWLTDLERVARRPRRIEPSLEAAREKLRRRYPLVPDEAIRLMADHGTRDLGDGRREWKFDRLHQSRGPQPWYREQAEAYWRRITCPVLYLDGSRSFIHQWREEIDARLAVLRARRVTIEGAGHHPHLEKSAEVVRALLDFLPR